MQRRQVTPKPSSFVDRGSMNKFQNAQPRLRNFNTNSFNKVSSNALLSTHQEFIRPNRRSRDG